MHLKAKAHSHELEHLHTKEAIRDRILEGPRHSYLKDFVYGAIDGAVTTFAVVMGVAGANLSVSVIVIMGLANVIADGFSMSVGNFLGTRSELELRAQARAIEERHIEEIPEGEKEEVRQIFAAKGFKGEELEKVVETITRDKEVWLDTMLQEEFGLAKLAPSPIKAASVTFAAFFAAGMVPLLAFCVKVINPGFSFNPFPISLALTGLVFFLVGAIKSRFVVRTWYAAGLETLAVGATAAALAYFVGGWIASLVGSI